MRTKGMAHQVSSDRPGSNTSLRSGEAYAWQLPLEPFFTNS